MRIAIGGLWHETNTFAHTRTELADFVDFQFSEGRDVLSRNHGVRNEIGGFIDSAATLGMELVPIVFAAALPSSTVSEETYRYLRKKTVDRLQAAGALDGILLALHGSMVAENVDDVEADLLGAVRKSIGRRCPVIATLDLHANVSERTATEANVLVGYDTYPHVDIYDRGCEAARIMKTVFNAGSVARAFRKLPLLTAPPSQGTSDEPMRTIMSRVQQLEQDPRILTITVCPGYPYSDTARVGMAIAVYSNGDKQLAEQSADELAQLILESRRQFTVTNISVSAGVSEAIACSESPVILVDAADNVGGGAPGDGTVLLRELLLQNARDAVVIIADSESVASAARAGVNATVEMNVGGKFDSQHGEPVPILGTVRLLSDGVYRHRGSYMTGLRVSMGRTAVVVSNGVEIVLTERKVMPFDAEQLRCLGIDPGSKKIIVVKSALAWKAAYGAMARKVIYVDTPGLCPSNLLTLPYRKIPRPIYPLDPINLDES